MTTPIECTGQAGRGSLRILLLSIALLSACSRQDALSDLKVLIERRHDVAAVQVEPVPELKSYAGFNYRAASTRSPFQRPPDKGATVTSMSGQQAEPDPARIREELESHPLSGLTLVGTLRRHDVYEALIEDPDGAIHRVGIGGFLGRNHGQIRRIEADQLLLVELVTSGSGGWIERPQTLGLTRSAGLQGPDHH